MPIKFNCHKCGASLRVPEKHVGKKARCPKCDAKCIVPHQSQDNSSGALRGDFEDSGNVLLRQPVAATPVGTPESPVQPPLATPLATPPIPPAMAAPVAAPISHGGSPQAFQSPYAAPLPSKAAGISGGNAGGLMQPLYEARFFMKVWGWATFVTGILYCLTIVGILVAWLFIWMGWLVKGAGEAVTIGVETGDQSQLRLANERIATFFRIIGILSLIGLVVTGLYLLFVVLAIVGAAVAG